MKGTILMTLLVNTKFGHLSHERDHIDLIRQCKCLATCHMKSTILMSLLDNAKFGHLSHEKDHIDVIRQVKVWPPVT